MRVASATVSPPATKAIKTNAGTSSASIVNADLAKLVKRARKAQQPTENPETRKQTPKNAADRSSTKDRWGTHLRKKLAQVLSDIKKGVITDKDLANSKMRERYKIGDPMAKKIKEKLAGMGHLVKKGNRYKIADKYRSDKTAQIA